MLSTPPPPERFDPPCSLIFKKLPGIQPPPASVIDFLAERYHQQTYLEENHGSYKRRILRDWQGRYSGPVARIQRGGIGEDFDHWARENIADGFHQAGAGWIDFQCGDPPSIGAHTDRTRSIVIGWSIFKGGFDAELTFWRERGQDYLRDTRGLSFESSDNLEKILSVADFAGSWYFLNPHVLHGLENMSAPYMDIAVAYNHVPDRLRHLILE